MRTVLHEKPALEVNAAAKFKAETFHFVGTTLEEAVGKKQFIGLCGKGFRNKLRIVWLRC